MKWQVKYFNYEGDTPAEGFAKEKPVSETSTDELYFAWWNAPAPGVTEDKFATESSTTFDIAPGEYTIELTSDDGARLYVDGKLLINHWDVHEPATDEVKVVLGGRHRIRIEHFEASGFSTLDFRLRQ